jgi:GntR family transcriptional regulator
MKWRVQTSSGKAIYDQIAEQIRHAIAVGQLRTGERLPSVRQLSRELLVNPNTVARAYQELDREGLLVSRPGLGIFVASPRRELTQKARDARLLESLDRWLTQAVNLGFSSADEVRMVEERAERFQWNQPASTAS